MSLQLLKNVIANRQRKTLGIMSGTSADGVDLAFCIVDTTSRTLTNLKSGSIPYPQDLRDVILETAHKGTAALPELIALSNYLGHFYADCITKFCMKEGIALSDIDLIGSHGQTIAHMGEPLNFLGSNCHGTLQIGEAEIIAKKTGVVTVSDFRSGDIALGGSGAPLVPIYHQIRFAQPNMLRVVVNIGGISNITVLDGDTGCAATDTGPGNCLIDTSMKKLFRAEFDRDGEIAKSGKLQESFLQRLLQDRELTRPLPTSYDRKKLLDLLERDLLSDDYRDLEARDIICTVTELTVRTIAAGINLMSNGKTPCTVLVCGGGVCNKFMMSRLAEVLSQSKISSTTEFGSDPSFVEAEAFAYLANLTLDSLPGNVPVVTGATRPAILGKISQP